MALAQGSYPYLLYRKALAGDASGLAPVFLDVAVLDRYRGKYGYSLVRSNSIGRLKKEGAWSLDFGISPGEATIHASVGDLAQKLPPEELEHWVRHVVSPPMSDNFIKTRLTTGACIDDGDTRPW